MPIKNKHSLICFIFVFLVGCAGVTSTDDMYIEGNRCSGKIEAPPEGLVESSDEKLLKTAVQSEGKGGLCKGKVFETQKNITVYRVWNSKRPNKELGRWWSFDKPEGARKKYREANAICPSWSDLDRMTSCTIKIGKKIAIGPGQSAYCEKINHTYPQSAVNQVYIPNERNKPLLVENCKEGMAWPPTKF